MIKKSNDKMLTLTEKGKELLKELKSAGWDPDLVHPSFYPREVLDEPFVDWDWFIQAVEKNMLGEELPLLFTSGMIAELLGVTLSRVRNVLDNWDVLGPVIHLGRVKIYSSETLDQVARALAQIEGVPSEVYASKY